MKKALVIKFGGTSVSSKKNINTICAIVKKEINSNPVVVVSALSGVTDLLLNLNIKTLSLGIKKIEDKHLSLMCDLWLDKNVRSGHREYISLQLEKIKEIASNTILTKAAKDMLISHGEIMSSYIITEFLKTKGVAAQQIIASELIVTDDNYGAAEFIIDATVKKVKGVLSQAGKKKITPVVTGFIGATVDGQITTFGRGGSDYSASIIGYSIGASEVQIWTDVDGIFTADPRFVRSAKIISEISYKEASEIAFFGAKVLHPRTIRPLVKARIPLRVLNTLRPNHPGTLIIEKPKLPAAVIAFKRNITLVNMSSSAMLLTRGFLAGLFSVFAKYGISIDLVSASEVSISVTLDNNDNLKQAIKELKKNMAVSVSRDFSVISIVGSGITDSYKNMGMIFDLLSKKQIKVKMISYGATNINVSFVVPTENLETAVKILHDRFLIKELIK